jgi:pyruvate/oxaloacetate carboxyltransferase
MNVKFTETVLRDANQSLIATRMPYQDFERILCILEDFALLTASGALCSLLSI